MADADKQNLYQKLVAITDEIGTIEKTGRNSQQGYAFMEQSQIVAELRPLLKKYGVMIVPEVIDRRVERYDVTRSNGKQGVDVHVQVDSRFTIINADNPDERIVCAWDGGEAIDSGDKATNKAITASNKYFLIKLFNISDKEDADGDTPAAAPAASRQAPPAPPSVSTFASEKQVGLLLAKSRVASGLDDRAEIIAWFTDNVGKQPNQVLKSEMDAVLEVIEQAAV